MLLPCRRRATFPHAVAWMVAWASLPGFEAAATSIPERAHQLGGTQVQDRPITYDDLLEIVDIGVTSEHDNDGLAVSPDGTLVALEIRQAILSRNSNEIRWRLISLAQPGKTVDAGDGGEPIYLYTSPGLATGFAPPQVPQWTPDSRWFIYRERLNGQVQLWRTSADGVSHERLSKDGLDVASYVISPDGLSVLYSVCEENAEAQRRFESEGDRGYLYDDRFIPEYGSNLPMTVGCIGPAAPESVWARELSSGVDRPATEYERREYYELMNTGRAQHARSILPREPIGARRSGAWLERVKSPQSRGVDLPLTVVASAPGVRQSPISCRSEHCTGYFKGLWIDEKRRSVYFIKWENEDRYGELALYRWDIARQLVTRIFRTGDLIEGCSPVPHGLLLCVDESATIPARLVTINLANGNVATVFDPNPRFGRLILGDVKALAWRDKDGNKGFGHLIKPINYQLGQRYPLIVVQYRSRGFLRGGVGDESPIQILASKGFLVLSFDRPRDLGAYSNARSAEELDRILWTKARDRRLVWSVLDAGIQQLVDSGLADSRRVGITGLSDGANTGVFGLIHAPKRFAAASLSWTQWNPITYYLSGRYQRLYESWGLGDPKDENNQAAWREISMAMNSDRVRTPLLLQVADAELLPETQTVTEFERAGNPVEMYVFRNERHIKVQPVHRYNIYRRNVQWFEFWLLGVEESETVDSAQYLRWRRLRERWRQHLPGEQSAADLSAKPPS
jgi:hypothetical protein